MCVCGSSIVPGGRRTQFNFKVHSCEGETKAQACANAWLRKLWQKASEEEEVSQLLQLRVLRLGFLQDGDVGVGVFPESEEVFVGGESAYAGSIGIGALGSSRL